MTKAQLLAKLRKDYDNAVESRDEKRAARLAAIGKVMYETPEDELGDFIERNFSELKALPESGADFRSYKKLEGKEGLASMFGYGGDAKGVSALFGNGKRSWKTYDDRTLTEIAKNYGYGSLREFKDHLKSKQSEYDRDIEDERTAKMAEDVRKARADVVENEMNPEFTKHPFEWGRSKLLKIFLPNMTESAIEDALAGKGSVRSDSFTELGNFAKDHPLDVLADVGIGAASAVPVGNLAARAAHLGKVGRVLIEGAHQGANAAAGEFAGHSLHDKEFEWDAIPEAVIFGSMFESFGKTAGDYAKGALGNKSDTAKGIGKTIEDAFADKKEVASDYVQALKDRASKFDTTDNPARDDFVMTKDNFDFRPITKDDVRKAKEAEELFDYLNTGKRPQVPALDEYGKQNELIVFDGMNSSHRVPVMRDMTDKEISKAFSEHPILRDYQGETLRSKSGGKFRQKVRKYGKDAVELGKAELAPTIKAYRKFQTSESDREYQKRIRQERKEARWMAGDIPGSASDPEWKEYKEWAKNNPEAAEKSKLLALR